MTELHFVRLDIKNLDLIKKFKHLDYLSLSKCNLIKNLNDITYFTELRWLKLDNCSGLTDITAADDLPSLISLEIRGCHQIVSFKRFEQPNLMVIV